MLMKWIEYPIAREAFKLIMFLRYKTLPYKRKIKKTTRLGDGHDSIIDL